MTYAIISLGGKQYRVQEGERLLVDRLPHDEGKTFHPALLMVGGNGEPDLAPNGVTVTARVVRHALGEKIRIGKYRPKSGYKRHTGFRSRLSQIEIESIGGKSSSRATAEKAATPKQAKQDAPTGMPKGYADLTVAEISEAVGKWNRPMLEAALEYERGHAKRKGALAAIESALEAKES
jgi:large subunit ribosomal protein L21